MFTRVGCEAGEQPVRWPVAIRYDRWLGMLTRARGCAMRLEPLYLVRVPYSGGWGADVAGPESAEVPFF